MTKRWNLVVDIARCNNCASCTLATMDEHAGNDYPGYAASQPRQGAPWISIRRHTRGEDEHVDVAYMPTMCNHCDRPACAVGADDAVVKRDDGIVLIDPAKAKGRRDLVAKCPYGAIHWNEALQLPQIWIFDAHLLDAGWPVPRCEQACATGAIRALKLRDEDMRAVAREQALEVSRPELGTAPRVYYKNLYRMHQRFVAGTVVAVRDGGTDCLQGGSVALHRDGTVMARAITDWFGDFKFDGLPDEPLTYELTFEHPGHDSRRVAVRTDVAGTSVGVIALSPSVGALAPP